MAVETKAKKFMCIQRLKVCRGQMVIYLGGWNCYLEVFTCSRL